MAPRVASRMLALALSVVVLLAACAPRTPGTTPGATPPTAQGQGPAQPRGPKVLTVAIQSELAGFILELTQDNSRIGGVKQPKTMVHSLLTIDNDKGAWIPDLATEIISVDRGTWKVNADGTMETTWKIRPNVKWHDGQPFTSDDLLFSFEVLKDPAVTTRVGTAARLMQTAAAPDPHTLVIAWSAAFADADRAPGLAPLPRHLLEESYRADKAEFVNHPKLSTEFVGLGPYRLEQWVRGAQLELVRFDDYFRGRPPLDRVIVRFLQDPSTMVANILSEAVDVVLPPAVDLDSALDVRERWSGTGHQVLIGPSGNFRYLVPQLRPDYAKPTDGLTNVTVRRALYHAMDRKAMVDVLGAGVAPTADSWISPNSPLRRQVESAIPQYPYDPNRAQQLLTQAGWVRGADGVLVHQTNGERFEVELNGGATRYIEREQQIVADGWKAVGAHVTFFNLPPNLANVLENRVTRPGAGIYAVGEQYAANPHTRNAGGPHNRWSGANYGAYSNPQVDALIDRLETTIVPDQRVNLMRELLTLVMGDVVVWPMYWDLTNVLALKHVKGIPGGEGGYHTWNFFAWDRE